MSNYQSQSEQIQSLLGLAHAPIAMTFCDSPPQDVPGLDV